MFLCILLYFALLPSSSCSVCLQCFGQEYWVFYGVILSFQSKGKRSDAFSCLPLSQQYPVVPLSCEILFTFCSLRQPNYVYIFPPHSRAAFPLLLGAGIFLMWLYQIAGLEVCALTPCLPWCPISARNRGILNWIPSVWRINFVWEHPLVSGSFCSLYLFALIPPFICGGGGKRAEKFTFLKPLEEEFGVSQGSFKGRN